MRSALLSVVLLLSPALAIAQHPNVLVVDLDGKDFDGAFTSRHDGIAFNWYGHGKFQMAWTNANRRVGFLWIDLWRQTFTNPDDHTQHGMLFPCPGGPDCNGKVDSARELLSDFSPQAPITGKEWERAEAEAKLGIAWQASGFFALARWDDSCCGGNGNGKIDASDAIWKDLRLWIDTCHNGDSTCGENLTMEQAGITSISVAYSQWGRMDQYGNEIRYRGTIKMQRETDHASLGEVYFTLK
jgi:hypothetical protein